MIDEREMRETGPMICFSKIGRGRSLVLYVVIMIILSVLPSRGFGGEPAEPPVPSGPVCFGSVVFESPMEAIVVSYWEGINFSREFYSRASVSRMGNKALLAEIYYGALGLAPAAPENVPSTKIDLGSVIASVACITKRNSQKTCHVSLMPAGAAGKPLIFLYHDLSEADSAIADRMWRSAHTDDRCEETPGD